jgi:hypothetical protein
MEMLSFGLPAPVKKKGQAQCLPLDRCGIKDGFRPPDLPLVSETGSLRRIHL